MSNNICFLLNGVYVIPVRHQDGIEYQIEEIQESVQWCDLRAVTEYIRDKKKGLIPMELK